MGRYIKTPNNIFKKSGINRSISGILAVVLFITSIPAITFFSSTNCHDANAANWKEGEGFKIPASSLGNEGTADNPFTVLEIVPNASMASFGYLVQDQEPVDIEEVRKAGKEDLLEDYITDGDDTLDVNDVEFKSILNKKLKNGNITQEMYDSYNTKSSENSNHYGTFKYVGDNKGDFILSEREEKVNEFEKVGDNQGDYIKSSVYKIADNNYNASTQYYQIKGTPKKGEWTYVDTTHWSNGYISADLRNYVSKGDYKREYYANDDSDKYYYIYDTKDATGQQCDEWWFKDTTTDAKAKYDVTFEPVIITSGKFNKNSNKKYYVLEGNSEYTYVGAGKGNYKQKSKYIYTFTKCEAGKGSYSFDGMAYKDNSKLTKNQADEYEWFENCSKEILYTKPDYMKKDLKGYISDDDIMIRYKEAETYNNTELFKKYGIGLAYKDNDIANGEDVDNYVFEGWYYDKYGVNKYDEAKRLSKNTNVYAKWKTIYPSGAVPTYKVTFDKNCKDDEFVLNMGATDNNVLVNGITEIEEKSFITAPLITPKRLGYKFSGWYTAPDCKVLFDYNTQITSDIVLYAGWNPVTKDNNGMEHTYTLKFDANTGNPDDDIIVPAPIQDYHSNGLLNDFTLPILEEPVRDGFAFAGWYYNKACTKVFTFGEDLSDDITTDSITLYAKWVENNSISVYDIVFVLNEPEIAINDAELRDPENGKVVNSIKADCAGYIKDGIVPKLKPTLDGNITAKLKKYIVKVITVTPEDLNGDSTMASHNRELIDRANLIVINQTVNEGLCDLWKNYRNKNLFCKDDSQYDTSKKTFGDNDLSWITTERIWKKVSVGSQTANGKSKKAPLIFDYNIYKNTKRTGTGSNNLQKRYFSDTGSTIQLKDNAVSANNTFKLYLLTQQMNPVTLYRAYLAYPGGDSSKGEKNWAGCRINTSGNFLNEKKAEEISKWNEEVLLPYEAMVKSDYTNNKDDILDSLGFDLDPTISSSVINYRSLVTYSNLLKEVVKKKDLKADKDMQEYMKKKNINGYGDNYDMFSMTDGMYYLLNSSMTTTNIERDLNILEIEPSDKEEAYKTPIYWYWYIARYVTNYSGKITTQGLSTYDFIGRVYDLNAEFDVIYIGANTTGLDSKTIENMPNNPSNGNKKYTYAHTGITSTNSNNYTRNAGSVGDASSPVTTLAYPGNDITKVKYDELLNYAATGYPIVFSRDMINTSSMVDFETLTADDINSKIIDKASYIYELMYTLMTQTNSSNKKVYDGSYFFENQYNSKAQDKKFTEALTIKKFSIADLITPIEYVDKTVPGNSGKTPAEIYINGENPDDKKVKFSFTIKSQANSNYIVKLYIDTNADGKFSEEEKLDSLSVYDETLGKYVRYNKLVRDHKYIIERAIDDYVGAIPWCLNIIDSENTGVRCTKRGMCAIQTSEKTRLNILQINSNEDNPYKPTLYLPTAAEIKQASDNHGGKKITDEGVNKDTYFQNVGTFKKDTDLVRNAGNFYYYISTLNEFEINITRLSVKEFQEKVAECPNFFKVNNEGPNNDPIVYNMLILGFSDCYTDITDNKSLKLIEKFINEGNTVLFTHDTTSFVNADKSTYDGYTNKKDWWGYNINQYFRGILGMDRYDVKNNVGDSSKADSASDWPYAQGTRQSAKDYLKSGGKMLAQGFSRFILRGYLGSIKCNKVSKANDGQLVSYPYKLDDSFTVADTHSQYYQLDLESNDIVVWYTLHNPSGTDPYLLKNDVRNNYYIYNKGNITYSGVGHGKNMSEMEVKLFVNTMVAAYNATVQPTVPVIKNSDMSTDNNDTDFLYVDYDATVSAENAEPFGEGVFTTEVNDMTGSDKHNRVVKRTYFTLKNNSIVLNKRMTVHYFPVIEKSNGVEVILDGKHKDPDTGLIAPKVELPLTTCRYDFDDLDRVGTVLPRNESVSVEGVNLKGTLVESGEYYYVDIPIQDDYFSSITYDGKKYTALDKKNKFKIQIQVVMRYGKDLTSNLPLVGIRNVVYMKRGNFILD